MATVRFAIKAPLRPDLAIPAVPATFSGYICDIDVSDQDGQDQAGRMRYAGMPYGVIELGSIDSSEATT